MINKIFLVNSKKVKINKIYCVVCGKYRKFKNSKMPYILQKTVHSIICSVAVKMKRYLKKKNQLRY